MGPLNCCGEPKGIGCASCLADLAGTEEEGAEQWEVQRHHHPRHHGHPWPSQPEVLTEEARAVEVTKADYLLHTTVVPGTPMGRLSYHLKCSLLKLNQFSK